MCKWKSTSEQPILYRDLVVYIEGDSIPYFGYLGSGDEKPLWRVEIDGEYYLDLKVLYWSYIPALPEEYRTKLQETQNGDHKRIFN
jgi:hypothetical protein